MVLKHDVHGLLFESLEIFVVFFLEHLKKMVRQKGDIFLPLPEGMVDLT